MLGFAEEGTDVHVNITGATGVIGARASFHCCLLRATQ
jgi:hypothetical protein